MTKKETSSAQSRWMFIGLIGVAVLMTFLIVVSSGQKRGTTVAATPPTLSVEAILAPADSTCAQVHSAAVKGVAKPLKEEKSAPCGLSFTIDAGEVKQYVALRLDPISGPKIDTSEMPKTLYGSKFFAGKITWNVNLPSPLKAPMAFNTTVLSSDRIVTVDMKWLRMREYRPAAVQFLQERNFIVLRNKFKISP